MRTVWGDPDFEGVYTNIDEWGIPFERPATFDGRSLESITSGELAKLRAERRDEFLERLATSAPAEPGTIGWYDNLNTRGSRAWLIVDPRDGHIPPLTAAGQLRAKADAERQSRPRGTDTYADQSAYSRCISRGVPGSMIPEAYGNAYEIHQAPGKERPTFPTGALRTAFRGVDLPVLRLSERFTPLGPRRLQWSVTVDDATTWVRPWTFAMELTKVDRSQQPYEYACHEGNYGLRNILSTARALEEREER